MKYDPPTEIHFHKNGFINFLFWKNDKGQGHRENDLPAYISYHNDGSIYQKTWEENGKKHRLYSPAYICFTGYYENWYIEGQGITEEVREFIKEYDLPKWQEWNDNHKMLFRLRFV